MNFLKSIRTAVQRRKDLLPASRLQSMDFMFAAGILILSVLVAWLFYDSVFGLSAAAVCIPLFFPVYRRRRQKKSQHELEAQFQDALGFAAGALEAGYSAENAWKEAETETARLYGDRAVFVLALRRINRQVELNEPIENLMLEFARQSGSENIRNFAEVFYFARRSGGNMTAIMRRTADRLRQNFQVQEEIRLSMSAKQLEQQIMSLMPIGILAYLRFGNSGFLEPLYHNQTGILIMTGCLALYAAAWRLGAAITEIEV